MTGQKDRHVFVWKSAFALSVACARTKCKRVHHYDTSTAQM